ncbi:MAG TPA: hypothetical protein VF857_09025, partial [Spirochaetota bacterium]
YHLAATIPDFFAAIAPVAETMMDTDLSQTSPISIIHVHGTNDPNVPYDGSSLYPPVDSIIALWRIKNGCQKNTIPTTSLYT